MDSPDKSRPFLPTLAILLAFLPTALMLGLVACSAGGNWAFLILGGIVYLVSEILCGAASLVLGILSIRRGWGRKRGIAAVVISSLGLLTTIEVVGAFLVRGLLI